MRKAGLPAAARLALTALPTAAAAAIPAMAPEALSTKAGCAVCHAADKKGVGPSYQEIAARYRGDAGAAATRAQRVRQGSVGVSGKVPMPPTPPARLGDANLKALVAWVLARP